MSKTYAEIIQQIEELRAEAERMKRDEVGGVITRIKEAISAYGLKPADLGFGAGRAKAGRKGKPGRKPGKASAKAVSRAKFRDADGNVWVGRGPRPRWLREALATGKTLKDFAI
jgi:DNA-binding protein H-NS